MKRLILPVCLLVCGLPALPEGPRLSFGAVGGVRLSRGAPAGYHDESPRYTLGPTFEVSFGEHLAVEVNALYKRVDGGIAYGVLSPSVDSPVVFSLRNRASSWEFPILGKYYFGRRNRRDRFFVATGYSFQRTWTTYDSAPAASDVFTGYLLGLTVNSLPGRPTVVGAAFGAGVARRAGPVTVTPAFRYTRWGSRTDGASRNQAEILLSLAF